MLRTRSTDGTTTVLPETVRFVEICDADGQVARLIYRDEQGGIQSLGAGDPVAARYAQTFKVKFCPVIPR